MSVALDNENALKDNRQWWCENITSLECINSWRTASFCKRDNTSLAGAIETSMPLGTVMSVGETKKDTE